MAVRRRLLVQDSNITELGYDHTTKTLEVVFKAGDAVYEYANVDPIMLCRILQADSIGSAVAQDVVKHKDLHPFVKRTRKDDDLIKSQMKKEKK